MKANNAVVLINKGPGCTSFECLKYIKRNVNKKTGHCGTLDKFATGLIIACCGTYTKKVPLFMGMDKTYIAKIEFGKETDTLDPEGEVVKIAEVPELNVIEACVEKLTGKIIQIPPVYSAIHVNGKRSYQLARDGKDVDLQGREVTIYKANIISYEKPYLEIELKVSKGTYIRSYARDLGKLCNSCAYVTSLCRTQIGPFSINDSIKFDDQEKLSLCNEETSKVILDAVENYTRV